MDTLPTPMEWGDVEGRICAFLDRALETAGADGFVLGLSGGVDSATVAHLASRKHAGRTLGVLMPDTSVTPRSETDDGQLVADALGIRSATVPLDGIMGEYAANLGGERRALGNLRARTRSAILYHYANSGNLLVLGSTDRSEHLLGYYTKFGDGAADAVPIISLYKTQVRGLAGHLGVPPHIVAKKSSPHLWPGHDAEDELGAAYDTIDRILYGTHEMCLPPESCARRASVPVRTVHRILGIVGQNRHKREGPLRPPAP
jgi:NAD+ synthase